jgi:hypothetical protein
VNRTESIVWRAVFLCGRGSDHPNLMHRATLDWLALDAAVDVVLAARRN